MAGKYDGKKAHPEGMFTAIVGHDDELSQPEVDGPITISCPASAVQIEPTVVTQVEFEAWLSPTVATVVD